MPTYAFRCENCSHNFDETLTMAENGEPLKKPCPKCKKKKVIRDYGSEGVAMSLDATLSPNKATGGAWNELMAKIKPGIPTRFRKNLDAASSRRGQA